MTGAKKGSSVAWPSSTGACSSSASGTWAKIRCRLSFASNSCPLQDAFEGRSRSSADHLMWTLLDERIGAVSVRNPATDPPPSSSSAVTAPPSRPVRRPPPDTLHARHDERPHTRPPKDHGRSGQHSPGTPAISPGHGRFPPSWTTSTSAHDRNPSPPNTRITRYDRLSSPGSCRSDTARPRSPSGPRGEPSTAAPARTAP